MTMNTTALLEPATLNPGRRASNRADFIARRGREAKSIALKDAFNRFEAHKPKRRSAAYRHQLAYTLRKFTSLHDTLVASISRDDIEAQLAGVAPSARNAFLRVLSAVFNYAIKRDWLEANPVQKVDRAEVDRGEIKVLTVEQAQGLLSACLELDPALLPYHALRMGIRGSANCGKN